MVPTLQWLKPRFFDEKLHIDRQCEDDPECMTKIMGVILWTWGFHRWCEARWGGASKSSINMVLATSLGLESIASSILADPSQSHYYIKGFLRLTVGVKKMFALTAATSRVSDVPLRILKEDDRLVKRLPDIDQAMADAAEYSLTLPEWIIDRLAKMAHQSRSEFRTDALQSVICQLGYARWRLRPARGLPWRLARGDVLANLEAFRREPRPAHCEPAQRIHDLLTTHMEPSMLVEPVTLLAETAWSSKTAEDPHSQANLVNKSHGQQYSRKTLLARALLRMASIFFKKDPLKGQIANLEARLTKLRRKNPMKITGIHVFRRALIATGLHGSEEHAGQGKILTRKVIKNSGKQWSNMAVERRRRYHALAEDTRDVAREKTAEAIRKVRRTLSEKQKKLDHQERPDGPRIRMSRCRFTAAELVEYAQLYDSGTYAPDVVEERRLEACKSLGPPSAAEVATLDLFQVPAEIRPQDPVWLPWLAYHRNLFRNTILRFDAPDGVEYWKFGLALQRPLVLVMNRAILVESIDPEFIEGLDEDGNNDVWAQQFEVDVSESHFSDDGAFPHETFDCLMDLSRRESGLLCSNSDWMTMVALREFLEPEPAGAHARGPGEEKTTCPTVEPEPWMEDPFMWDVVCSGGAPGKGPKVGKPSDEKHRDLVINDHFSSSSSEGSEIDDEEVMEALWAHRAAMGEREDAGVVDFSWWIRGGPSTMRRKGVAFDCYAAAAWNTDSKKWCVRYGMKRSVSFSIKLYGEEWCLRLCELWIARLKFFYDIYLSHGASDKFRYAKADLHRFVENPDIVVHAADCAAPVANRLGQVRRIAPRVFV